MSFKSEIVADSINGNRITTFLVTFPRYILAELNTHRVFSRNSASSRAIPFKKMVESVEKNLFIPIKWMKDHPGMQGTEYFTDEEVENLCLLEDHLTARDNAVAVAIRQNKKGFSKQICNRYLEPFAYHTCLVTSTEWENFFSLRANEAADIHIQKLAEMMLESYNTSVPVELKDGEWHIPFKDSIDYTVLNNYLSETEVDWNIDARTPFYKQKEVTLQSVIKISTAMCARTSYTVVGAAEKKQDYAADIKLHDRLSASGHWSPFEHCARAMNGEEYYKFTRTHPIGFEKDHDLTGEAINKWDGVPGRAVVPATGMDIGVEYGWCGNFRGFIQYRKFFPNENRTDSRVKKHKIK